MSASVQGQTGLHPLGFGLQGMGTALDGWGALESAG